MNEMVLLTLCVLILTAVLLLALLLNQRNSQRSLNLVSDLLAKSQAQNQQLAAMLKSQDPMTLAATMELLSPSGDNEVYIPKDDQSEATQWQELSGLGEVVYDDNSIDLYELGLREADPQN